MAEAAARRSLLGMAATGECDDLAFGDWQRASKPEPGRTGGVGGKGFVGLLTIGDLS